MSTPEAKQINYDPMAMVCAEHEDRMKACRADRDRLFEQQRALVEASTAIEVALRKRLMLDGKAIVTFVYTNAHCETEKRALRDAALCFGIEGSVYAGRWTLRGHDVGLDQPRTFPLDSVSEIAPLAP